MKQLLLFVFLFLMFSCQKETIQTPEEQVGTGSVFFSDSNNILWRHRVNTLEEVQKYLNVFNGIEIDVFFDYEQNLFFVKHDLETNTDLTLYSLFQQIENANKYYYWIDFKNLRNDDLEEVLARMEFIQNEFQLVNNMIIESGNTTGLKKVKAYGFYTSYWIPHFTYDDATEEAILNNVDKISNALKDCPHNAISASYTMNNFINDYFSNCTTHLWTNGLSGENGMTKIEELKSYPNVKVILVDYEKPF